MNSPLKRALPTLRATYRAARTLDCDLPPLGARVELSHEPYRIIGMSPGARTNVLIEHAESREIFRIASWKLKLWGRR